MRSLTRLDREDIRAMIREEIANANHSGRTSPAGIDPLGQGDPCETNERREPMDPTSTDNDSESSSLDRMVAADVAALRAMRAPRRTSTGSRSRRTRER